MVSLVLVVVARPQCCDVFWDDSQFIQDASSSWGNPLEQRGILYLGRMLDTCHRCALIEINLHVA